MGETSVADAAGAVAAARPKPATIAVPPRGSVAESLFTNGLSGMGFSPGPMSLVSSFFSDQGPFSFSQLLAGAIASPIAAPPPKGDDSSENDGAGFKRNRPMTLVVAPQQLDSMSPLFMVPPGLTPSGFLNSPAFLSPLQVTFLDLIFIQRRLGF